MLSQGRWSFKSLLSAVMILARLSERKTLMLRYPPLPLVPVPFWRFWGQSGNAVYNRICVEAGTNGTLCTLFQARTNKHSLTRQEFDLFCKKAFVMLDLMTDEQQLAAEKGV